MNRFEAPDFFPSRLSKKGIQREDVEEFSKMYGIPYDESIGLMFDFKINGKRITKIQSSKHLTRSEAAHDYYENVEHFLDRTQDVQPKPKKSPTTPLHSKGASRRSSFTQRHGL